MKIKQTLSVMAAVGLMSSIGGVSNAATATGSFQISMTIQSTCSVQSISDLAFGSQTSITSNLDAATTIGVVCTNGTPYNIGLSAGTGSGASVTSRLLTSGANTVPYSIYRDSNRTQVWGVTTNVDTQSGTGNGSTQNFTAYGRIAPVSNPTVGVYADTVAVTVTY